MMIEHARHFIAGQWTDGHSRRSVNSIDPANGDIIGSFADAGKPEAEDAIIAAREAFDRTAWPSRPRLRAAVLLEFADRLEARSEDLARLLSRENGKLQREAAHEIAAGISEARYYAGLARNIFGRVIEVDTGKFATLAREAAGVAAIIVPFNAPVTLLVRSLAPALAAGCTVVMKPAPQTALVHSRVIACLADIDDLPSGVVNSVNESGHAVAQTFCTHPEVDVISFTGSSATGKAIMAAAAPGLKRLSLELGGKSPAILFDDIAFEPALAQIARAGCVMAGQMCTAVSRVLVPRNRLDETADRLSSLLAGIRVGPGTDPRSEMGPMIDRENRDRVLGLIDRTDNQAQMILKGSATGPEAGAFVTPTLAAIEDLESSLVQEELFAPILLLEGYEDDEAAITRANATRYGLAASVWTNDRKRAAMAARGLRFGTVWLNAHNRLFAEAETGGYKESGIGRLHGLEGLNDFLETKHIYSEFPDD